MSLPGMRGGGERLHAPRDGGNETGREGWDFPNEVRTAERSATAKGLSSLEG